MVSFFSENYYIYHYSNVCSNAFIFMVILILFSVLLPFFTLFATIDKFWKPKKVFTDHPIIQFNNDEFLLELTYGGGSTSQFYQQKLIDQNNNNIYFISSINISPEEYSNKDIYNKIKIKGIVTKNGENNIDVKEIKFFLFFDYYMIEDVNIHLRSNFHIFYSSKDSFSKYVSNGDLVLKQNKGLTESYFMKTQGEKKNFEEEKDAVITDPFNRDEDYYFEYQKTNIMVERNGGNQYQFEFEFNINIPYYQDIIVELPNYTNLKNRWVSYSIIFFPTVFICYCLMEMVINNQIFKTRIRSDIPIKI